MFFYYRKIKIKLEQKCTEMKENLFLGNEDIILGCGKDTDML